MLALGFVSSVKELAAFSVAMFTEDERWTVGLLDCRGFVNKTAAEFGQDDHDAGVAGDDTIDSVIKDATGFIARERQKVVNAEEQADNVVVRKVYLLPDVWSKWQSQLQLDIPVSAKEKQRDEESDRRQRKAGDGTAGLESGLSRVWSGDWCQNRRWRLQQWFGGRRSYRRNRGRVSNDGPWA